MGAAPGRNRPASFISSAVSSRSETAGGLGDDIIGHRAFAETRFQRGGAVGDGQLARRLGGIVRIGRAQRPGMGQFLQQQFAARALPPASDNPPSTPATLQQFRHGALMDIGILAHIHGGEMKAERRHRLAQILQPAVGQIGVAIVRAARRR